MSALPPAIMRHSMNLKEVKQEALSGMDVKKKTKKERKGNKRRSYTFFFLLKKSDDFLQEKLQTLQLCRKA